MVIWINGAFGVGKTTVARRLAQMCEGAWLFDPEQIGLMLRRVWPERGSSDFQDLPLWRELTVRTLAAASRTPVTPIIVPMTLVNLDYFEEIIGGLGAQGVDVRHFTLMASAATVSSRIRWRLARPASRRWALGRVEACLAGLAGDRFATHVWTDARPAAAVARDIMAQVAEGGGPRRSGGRLEPTQ